MIWACGHAESSKLVVFQSAPELLAESQVVSDITLKASPSAKWTSRQASSPAGFAATLAGLFSATIARTFVPGFSDCARPSNRLPVFQLPSEPSFSPFNHALNQSSAETNSRARVIALPWGSVKFFRKNRFSAGASWAGLPSGNQIQGQPSRFNFASPVNAAQSGWGENRCHGYCCSKCL